LPHSSVNARLAAASGFMFPVQRNGGRAGMVGELALQSPGSRAVTLIAEGFSDLVGT